MMTDEGDLVASDVIDDFFKRAAPEMDNLQRVKVSSAVMELLRLVSGLAVVSKGDPKLARIGLIELIGQLCGMDWESVPFSITKVAYASSEPAIDIFAALKAFANVVQLDASAATADVLKSLLEPAPPAPPPPPPPPAITPQANRPYPAVGQGTVVDHVFRRAKFKHDGTPAATLVTYQSELPTGGMGPQLYGVILDDADPCKLLLETGEVVFVPKNTFLLASVADAAEYEHAPPYLLACLRAMAPQQWRVDPPIDDAMLDARFGQFTQPVMISCYAPEVVKNVQQVFENSAAVATGATVSTSLLVDGTPYSVTLDGRIAKTGPYITAKLVDANDNVVMRLDTPRLLSARGVYLFPLKDTALALHVL